MLAVVVLLGALGCGGGGDDEGAAKRAIEADAQERAERIALQLSDFPDGWRASEGGEAGDTGLRKCAGTDYSDLTIVGEHRSDDFASSETTQAFSTVTIFDSQSDVETATTRFRSDITSDEVAGCLRDAVEESDDADEFEVGEVDIGELSFTPPEVEG